MWQPGDLPVGHVFDEHLVRRLADHLDELVAHRLVHRAVVDERVVALRAPPVELLAAWPPVSALPLTEGGGHMSVCIGLVDAPKRKLPADLGLPVRRPVVPRAGSA